MGPLNCIIIDDDPLHTRVLKQYIGMSSDLVLKNSFLDATSGLNFLSHANVDLVFLDVDLPDINGWEVLGHIKEDFAVIMNSSEMNSESLKMNRHHIIDYLLKPFQFQRFQIAVDKVKERLNSALLNKLGVLFIRNKGGYLRIFISDILFVESIGDYVKIHTCDGNKYVQHTTLSCLYSNYLARNNFFQCHRSYVVNLEKLEEINERQIHLKGKRVPVSRNKYSQLLKMLNIA